MKLLPIILLAILTQALGNVLLSRGMKQVGASAESAAGAADLFHVAFKAASDPYLIFGILTLILGFVLLLTLLSRADLSYVMPVTSFSYVLTALLAIVMLNEKIPFWRWIGITLICAGVFLVSRGEAKTASDKEALKGDDL